MVKQPVSVNGVVRWKDVGLADQAKSEQKERKMVVLRHEIGDVLRDVRQRQGRTSAKSRTVPAFPWAT